MSKRVTFSDREIWLLLRVLKEAQRETSLDYHVIHAGRFLFQDIINKLQPEVEEATDE